jgi:hypothetical protein
MTHHIMPGTASRGQGDFGDRWVLSGAMLGLACLAADLGDAQLPLAYAHGMALSLDQATDLALRPAAAV